MEDRKTFKIITDDGKEIEYEIILAFKWTKTNKYYIVYTDNTKDENDKLNIYAAIYYPNDDTRLDAVETEEEWNEIERMLKKIQC